VGWWNSTIAMNQEFSSKFTMSDHKTITFFVKRLHSRNTLCPVHGSIANKTRKIWQKNEDTFILPSVEEPGETVLQNRPIH